MAEPEPFEVITDLEGEPSQASRVDGSLFVLLRCISGLSQAFQRDFPWPPLLSFLMKMERAICPGTLA